MNTERTSKNIFTYFLISKLKRENFVFSLMDLTKGLMKDLAHPNNVARPPR